MSEHHLVVVKVLVDAEFFKKCLTAYNEKLNKSNRRSRSPSPIIPGKANHGRSSSPNIPGKDIDLGGHGIVYKDSEIVSNTDIPGFSSRDPLPISSSTVVSEMQQPLIVPKMIQSSTEHVVKNHARKHVQKSKKDQKGKGHKVSSQSIPPYKRPKRAPWFYIGYAE